MRFRDALVAALVLSTSISLAAQGHGGGCGCGKPATPVVSFEIDHIDPPYQAAAAAEFDRWNRYIDAFDYVVTGDGVTAVNGKHEITFLASRTARSIYGINVDGDTFGFAFISPESAFGDFNACPTPPFAQCGQFDEMDVIMNSDFTRGFKSTGPIDFDDNRGPAFYGATAVHEIGHTLGFHHNFSNLSVMNYYEDFAAQYIGASDVAAAVEAYPTQAQSVVDLAVYPFHFDSGSEAYSATTPVTVSPETVAAGAKLTVRSFGLENVGTLPISDVEHRLYLSPDASITTADTLLGSVSFDGAVAPGAFWDDDARGIAFTVPSNIAAGIYFVGALITHSSGSDDEIVYNNSWTAAQKVTITGPNKRHRPVRR